MASSSGNVKALNVGLWAAQLWLAAAFGLFGSMKATQPLAQLATMMKWISTMSPIFVRTLGVLEILGAIGIVLPWLTGIKPKLTVAAALCFIILQVLAIGLHVSYNEYSGVGLNAGLIALAVFVFWGRTRLA